MESLDKHIIPYNNSGIYYWDELKIKINRNELMTSKIPPIINCYLDNKGVEPLNTNVFIKRNKNGNI